jgi:hypothetical protein
MLVLRRVSFADLSIFPQGTTSDRYAGVSYKSAIQIARPASLLGWLNVLSIKLALGAGVKI